MVMVTTLTWCFIMYTIAESQCTSETNMIYHLYINFLKMSLGHTLHQWKLIVRYCGAMEVIVIIMQIHVLLTCFLAFIT